MTKQEAIEKLGLEERGTVDTALPQEWVDAMNEALGVQDTAAHFVYFYPKEDGTSMGYVYPISDEGVLYLNRVIGERLPIKYRHYDFPYQGEKR